jgi:hypothetical protein
MSSLRSFEDLGILIGELRREQEVPRWVVLLVLHTRALHVKCVRARVNTSSCCRVAGEGVGQYGGEQASLWISLSGSGSGSV